MVLEKVSDRLCVMMASIACLTFASGRKEVAFDLEDYALCMENVTSARFDGIFLQTSATSFGLNAKIDVLKDIRNDLEMRILATRCDMNLTKCEPYDTRVLKSFCTLLNKDNIIYSSLLSAVKPPIRCPIKKGTFEIKNGILDFKVLTMLPLQGYKWLSEIKIVEKIPLKGKASGSKVVVFCLKSCVAIRLKGRNQIKVGKTIRLATTQSLPNKQ